MITETYSTNNPNKGVQVKIEMINKINKYFVKKLLENPGANKFNPTPAE